LDTDARVIMADAFTMLQGAANAMRKGTFGDFTTAATIGPAVPIQAQGGLGGSMLTVVVELI
jgi:hypothetical protein